MEKWIEIRKGGNFREIGEKFQIDPLLARLIRNRDVVTEEEVKEYLYGETLHSPHLMKDLDLAVSILREKIDAGKKIRIIGDYDVDGINATYILLGGLKRCGAKVDYMIPHRMEDGYGINQHLIELAVEDGVDTIITCDNGISALDAIHFGKSRGLTMLVTDHHDIPYEETSAGRVYKRSEADAIVNPKQKECPYPYKGLCGAVVAWKVVQALYEASGVPEEEANVFYENAAFATVGDVMDLTGENRTIVKHGLRYLTNTNNLGMRALQLQNNLKDQDMKAYHVGFVLGPCMNASGRLDTAKRSLELLTSETVNEASTVAAELVALNQSRKDMTLEGLEEAMKKIEEEDLYKDKVLVVYLPDCHESLAGIIAGRIREHYHKPVFVLTKGEEAVKGSGRSIEAYSMFEEMNKVGDVFLKFGGHPMAAGLSLEESRVEEFRQRINANCPLTEEDFIPKIMLDAVVPFEYWDMEKVESLSLLEPFGKANTKPNFAERDLTICSIKELGKNKNVLRLNVKTASGFQTEAVFFGELESFSQCLSEKYPEEKIKGLTGWNPESIRVSAVYYPNINEYNGSRKIQFVISSLR